MCRIAEVAKLADNLHPDGFLTFDEFAVEQLDQGVAHSRKQRVLP
jgi:hypothetical protein